MVSHIVQTARSYPGGIAHDSAHARVGRIRRDSKWLLSGAVVIRVSNYSCAAATSDTDSSAGTVSV